MDIDGEELTPEREDIALSHVDFSYDSKPILHDVSLTIPEKTTVAIVSTPAAAARPRSATSWRGSGTCMAAA